MKVILYSCLASLFLFTLLVCGVVEVHSKTTQEPTNFEKSITKNVISRDKNFTVVCNGRNLRTMVSRSFDGIAILGKKSSEYSENFSTKLNGTTFKGGVSGCRPIDENEVGKKDQYQDKPREIWQHATLDSANVLDSYFYAYPTPEFIVWKGGFELSNDSNHEIQKISLGENLYNIKLLIEKVETPNLGNYDFRAKNQFGIAKSSVILYVQDQVQLPTQGNLYTTIALIVIAVIAALVIVGVLIFCFIKKLCCFALPCFSNRLHGTQGRPDNKEVLGEDGKDERAEPDGTQRNDGSTNGRPDPEGPPGTAELNGVEGQDRQPEASKVLGTAGQDVGGVTQRQEAPNVTNQV